MRLTLDLVQDRATQIVDPNNQRALVLRGFKISAIENLGITRDMYGCIDLSDNEIFRIENIPKLVRLRSLILANNSVAWIAPDAFDNLTEMTSLVLSNNNVSRLSVLLPIGSLRRLERLSLVHNPVTKEPRYREFIIHLMKYSRTFRYLDFQRVTDQERQESKTFFSTPEGVLMLRRLVPEQALAEAESRELQTKAATKPKLSDDVLGRIRIAIMGTEDMNVVNRLEKCLKSGELTNDVAKLIGIE